MQRPGYGQSQRPLLHPKKLAVTRRRHNEAVTVTMRLSTSSVTTTLQRDHSISALTLSVLSFHNKELISDNFLSYNTLGVHATTSNLKLAQNGKNSVH